MCDRPIKGLSRHAAQRQTRMTTRRSHIIRPYMVLRQASRPQGAADPAQTRSSTLGEPNSRVLWTPGGWKTRTGVPEERCKPPAEKGCPISGRQTGPEMSHPTVTTSPSPLSLPRVGLAQEEAFSDFVDRAAPRAMRVAWRLLAGDASAAEDVVQDAFVAAWKALPGFRGDSTLDTWFFRILVRRAHNYRRWRNLRTLWCDPMERESADPKPVPGGDPMLRHRIVQALDRLTQRQRESFVLVHMDGFTVQEAASILGLRPGSVKSHLHRALQHLRTALKDLNSPSPDPRGHRSGDQDDSS